MTIGKDACQRCFQQRQGLVPLSDLVRELYDLGVQVLICRSCMKELVAVTNFMNFQGCEWAVQEGMKALSGLSGQSAIGETSEKSKKDPGKDFAGESQKGPGEVKPPKE